MAGVQPGRLHEEQPADEEHGERTTDEPRRDRPAIRIDTAVLTALTGPTESDDGSRIVRWFDCWRS